ncbi:MAG: 3-phosphoglycerate dehydrogenase [Bacteroidota bacterium]
MAKILVATEKPFAKAAIDKIKDIAAKSNQELIFLENYASQADLIKAVENVDAMIIRSDIASREVIEAGKQLKIIVRAGAGYDNIDLAVATEKGIVAMNTPGQNSNAVAELALGMMIYIARGLFNGKSGYELRGKKLGIHAYGAVGKYVAEIAKGFGMEIYAFDPFVKKETIEKDGVKVLDSVEELYKICQYVSLHIPANEHTKRAINYQLLSTMPKKAVLVNTARKEVIHEEDLLRIMNDREDFCYVSDIEPGNKDEFVRFAGRYFFTPKKMGAQTSEANINAGIAAINQIINFLEKGDRTFQVN